MTEPIVICKNLTKLFYVKKGDEVMKLPVVNNINLEVYQGEIFGVIGPNGAGKTTFLKLLCGLYVPDEGTAIICGHDVSKVGLKINRSIVTACFFSEELFPRLTVEQYLKYYCTYYFIPRRLIHSRIQEVLDFTDLVERRNEWITKLSTGLKKKLIIARVLLRDTPILILDEPMEHLDPVMVKDLGELFVRLKKEKNKTIIVTSHIMEPIERTCDRVTFLHNGKAIITDTPNNLKEKVIQLEKMVITIEDDPSTLVKELSQIKGIVKINTLKENSSPLYFQKPSYVVEVIFQRTKEDLIFSIISIARNYQHVTGIRIVPSTLSDVFVELAK